MNLLFDFVTLSVKTGAGEYIRTILCKILDNITCYSNLHIFALYDSSKGIAYNDLSSLEEKYPVKYVDIYNKSLDQLIVQYCIDRFFVGCDPYLDSYPGFEKIKCEVICVVHDICYKEMSSNHIYEYMDLLSENYAKNNRFHLSLLNNFNYIRHTCQLSKKIFKNRIKSPYQGRLNNFEALVKLIHYNPKAQIIVVSQYTKTAILYNYDIPSGRIKILYSPERVYSDISSDIENPELKSIIASKRKYFLMVSAYRDAKNPMKAVHAFERFQLLHNNCWLLAIGYHGKITNNHVITTNFLSDNDLLRAYSHCYALIYPSFFEGFGYPPLEAMHFGKPVLSANVTSMPEVLGDAAIYFSPFFESDIFRALVSLTDDNYEYYSKRSKDQYNLIKARQSHDLEMLVLLLVK
jgi:glycosyltransferase involved in cell wall biosynthesis